MTIFVVLICSNKVFIYKLWAEKELLMSGMDLPAAIASFIHLAFVFDLKYPAESEVLAEILQRSTANFGNDDGTRTTKKKTVAEGKLNKYYAKMGFIKSLENKS